MISVSVCNDPALWDVYVASRPDATGYHEWAWRDIFKRAFGHDSVYLVARDDGDAMLGVLPLTEIRSRLFGHTLTSLPFVNFAGVLASRDAVARALVEEAARLARERGCRHVELRHVARRFDDLPVRAHKVTMRLDLTSGGAAGAGATVWDVIDRKARNQVRKAQKSGLVVERGGIELVADFYQVFARNMRDLGTPVYSRRLFEEVLRSFPDRAHLIVVRKDAQPIAAGLTYRTRDMIEIPWASSIRDFNALCPNHLLYWHAIETAAAEGVGTFDFGRSTPGEGTYKFKEQWGAQPVPLHWEYWLPARAALPDQSPKNPKYRLMVAAWQRLPLGIANAIGPSIVKQIP